MVQDIKTKKDRVSVYSRSRNLHRPNHSFLNELDIREASSGRNVVKRQSADALQVAKNISEEHVKRDKGP